MSIPAGKLPLPELLAMKRRGDKIVMVTAYDAPGARFAEDAGIDLILVGDTAAMVVLGHPGTTSVTVDEMLLLTRTVSRQVHRPIVVGDLPFGSYETSNEDAVHTAVRFVKEGGADIVKLEGAGPMVSRARAIVEAGIPVMGHVGLTPQTSTALGGYKAQGRSAQGAMKVAQEALALQEAGCFSIVFEAIPSGLSKEVMPHMQIPVIGIGAGPATDGQVLVFHDLLGIREGLGARFVKRYANLQEEMDAGVGAYAADVRSRAYPQPEHGYSIDEAELEAFRKAFAR
jgi:3-methyl-2-oxobutanoate hydroxymethyltransferase